jgi:RHS repeat-associated protein
VRRVFASTSSAAAYGYDPYGTPLQATAPTTDFVYGRMFYNADSGLYLTKYRAFDPGAGRWLSRDPLGEETDTGSNLFAYVGGNPISYTDPDGRTIWPRRSHSFPPPSCTPDDWRPPGASLPPGMSPMSGDPTKPPPAATPPTPGADTAGTPPEGPDQPPAAGDLKEASQRDLQRAARQDGYERIDDWKTQELQLNSRDQILIDRNGNLYSVPPTRWRSTTAAKCTGASMSRISATLSIWSEKLDPEKISGILNFEPDRKVNKGIDRVPPRPRPTAYGWHVTCAKDDEVLAEEVFKLLFKRIESIRTAFPKLPLADPAVEVNFFLHVAPKSADVSLFMSRHVIEFISSMAGTLDSRPLRTSIECGVDCERSDQVCQD